jgi:hypothetical protein
MKKTLEIFDSIVEYRYTLFVVAYILFSFIGAYNIAHLVGFCYIILLLEQIVKSKTTDTQEEQ